MPTTAVKAVRAVVICVLTLGAGRLSVAADQPGLYLKGDLSVVQTAGNSQVQTLGLKGNLTKNWLRTSFVMNASAIRSQTKETAFSAVGTSATSYSIQETSHSKINAESYSLDAQLSYRLTESLYWFGAGAWTRDVPSGLKSRLVESAGFGYDLSKREGLEFKLIAAATLTQEKTYVADPSAKESYPGARLAYSYKQKVSDTTTLTHSLMFDQPFSPTNNFRIDTQGGLEVSITRSGSLALKANARLLYDNLPALREITLTLPNGTQTNTKVTTPVKKLDGQFLVSLVVNISRKGGVGRQTSH
jgi:putative salt-induced outer membrane protein YdiY